jgi:hypothetical protein
MTLLTACVSYPFDRSDLAPWNTIRILEMMRGCVLLRIWTDCDALQRKHFQHDSNCLT